MDSVAGYDSKLGVDLRWLYIRIIGTGWGTHISMHRIDYCNRRTREVEEREGAAARDA